ncbi:MAG: FtsX-like permease family protein [Roseivirga sp.]|nr:FtsX-like permease family protein [Roseivirga sp.]
MNQEPPKWALRFLRLYCKPRLHEIIEGDVYELFYKRIEKEGLSKARRRFSWDVMRFFRVKYIKGFEDINSLNNIAMFKNYFKVSLRSLLKHKFYSFINIAGLSLGLAACLLITMYITNELSYDKFHKDADRVYRMAGNQMGSWTPARLGIQAKMDFPEIEEIVRIQGPFNQTFNLNGTIYREARGFNADSTFHKVFTIDFIEGNPDEALKEPNSVVLTQSLADKYFPNSSAYGQLIKMDGETTKITGVIADPPKNTHFYYNYINSMPHETWVTVGNWTGNNFFTYAKLTQGASAEALEAKFPEFKRKYAGAEMLEWTEYDTYDELLAASRNPPTYSLKAMTDLHLFFPSFALGSNGDIDNVYTFIAVAIFILIIACINFMNLSTARSAARSKEVGMRKVLGSLRGNLINQFLVESMIVSLVAMVLAMGLSALFLNGFNTLANRNFELIDLLAPQTLLYLLVLVLIVGLLAGSYPAFYLSGFKPIKALKGEMKSGSANAFLRKGLVAFQFAISIFLIISTVIVYAQLQFMGNQKLGFEPEQVLLVKNGSRLSGNINGFRNAVEAHPNVENFAMSDRYFSGFISNYGYQTVEDNPRSYNFMNMFVSAQFQEALDLELVDGRFFNKELVSDTSNVLVNEAAAKWLGWDGVVGGKVSRGEGRDFRIIGIIKDFHYTSLKQDILPMIIRNVNNEGWINEADQWWGTNYLSIKINGNFQNTVRDIEQAWSRVVPDEPFDYTFMDDSFAALYEEERRFGKLFTASSGLAIVIACLGLFALAAFTLERRFKEIAIRKVLGATVPSLSMLILTDFTKLVAIGAVIAIPSGYFLMKEWLADFAYQLPVNPFYLIAPALVVAIIAWLTVGFQSVKTALGNPVKALRSE